MSPFPQHPRTARGAELHERIVWAAKNVFLELGFERASMDAIAGRAHTSKRTLYAHFGDKESLFLAVAELTRELYLDRLGHPDPEDDDAEEAIVTYCARFLEVLLWESASRTCRLGISEAERMPAAAAAFYDTLFRVTHDRLAAFLASRWGLGPGAASEATDALMGQVLYPRMIRVLFGVDDPRAELAAGASPPADLDLSSVRTATRRLLSSLPQA